MIALCADWMREGGIFYDEEGMWTESTASRLRHSYWRRLPNVFRHVVIGFGIDDKCNLQAARMQM